MQIDLNYLNYLNYLIKIDLNYLNYLKGVFGKNERGYRISAIKKALLVAINLTSICCVYKAKIV